MMKRGMGRGKRAMTIEIRKVGKNIQEEGEGGGGGGSGRGDKIGWAKDSSYGSVSQE